MTCGGCVSSVTNALKAVNGVTGVAVSLGTGEARVEFDENTTSRERLSAAVRHAGFQPDTAAEPRKAKGGCCG